MQGEDYMKNEMLNPDDYEQLYLLNIESQNKMAILDIENFCVCMRQKSVKTQDLRDMINSLKMYDSYFLSYEPIARRLDKLGKPQLSKRLNEIICDIRETSKIFREVVGNVQENISDEDNMKTHVTKAKEEDRK
jgi:hypothetical protein